MSQLVNRLHDTSPASISAAVAAPVLVGPAIGRRVWSVHQPGFFHLLKPYLFYNNRCEFVSEPVRPSHLQPSLAQFARQLYESVDAIRFVQDRDLAFVLYQAILWPQVSRIGGAYFRKKNPGMSRESLRRSLASDGPCKGVFEGIGYWFQTIPGTNGYHHSKKNQMLNMSRWSQYIWGAKPAYFSTIGTPGAHNDWIQACLLKVGQVDGLGQSSSDGEGPRDTWDRDRTLCSVTSEQLLCSATCGCAVYPPRCCRPS